LRRIKLDPLPAGIEGPLATARGIVDEFADGMLPPPVFVVPSAPRQILAPRVKGTTEAHA